MRLTFLIRRKKEEEGEEGKATSKMTPHVLPE